MLVMIIMKNLVVKNIGGNMILEMANANKRKFDVNNKKDIEAYKIFLTNQRWGSSCCPFVLEFPYLTIPDMIKDKMMNKYMKIEQE